MVSASDFSHLAESSKSQFGIMVKYTHFFQTLFSDKLSAFGFEQLSHSGNYIALSNLPEIAELFIESKAYENFCFLENRFFSTQYGLIHLNATQDNLSYHAFRDALNQNLKIQTSLYQIENCLGVKNIFVWNFKDKILDNEILLQFMNHKPAIQYVLEEFKQIYYQRICKEIQPVCLKLPDKEKPKNIFEKKLVDFDFLKKQDLSIKDIKLTQKETRFLYYYLKGFTTKEIAQKMFLSCRTIEDYIHGLKEKLCVQTRSQVYEIIRKLSIWKNLL